MNHPKKVKSANFSEETYVVPHLVEPIITICQIIQKMEVLYGAITLNEFPGVYEV